MNSYLNYYLRETSRSSCAEIVPNGSTISSNQVNLHSTKIPWVASSISVRIKRVDSLFKRTIIFEDIRHMLKKLVFTITGFTILY